MAQPNAQEDFAKLSDDLATLRADVAKLTETLASIAKAEGESAAEAVASRVRAGKARAEAAAANLADEGYAVYEDAKGRAQALGGDVGAAIERNPYGAVLAALGVGFVFGLLTRGR
ncbi:hypothetical protein MWN33_02745 [Starkeya koreensis]|uniref:DUF883 domain-containing protein n=1 Tax=Ancylobacter koreensis TaxID=266121 RepID=A0ABT0DI34_9HYPH|nr:hypothetical protein [Ancylobacter koreensis]MCK0206946.1 hypothetical protein [Ancylobacter koreensis]